MLRKKRISSAIKNSLFPLALLSLSASVQAFDYQNATSGLTRVITDAKSEAVTQRAPGFIVGGYVSDWAQYERKFDLEKIDPSSFNRLNFSFLAICGTQAIPDASPETIAELQRKVDLACTNQQRNRNEIVSMDMWADFQNKISQRQQSYPWLPAYDGVTKTQYDLLNRENTLGLMGQLLWMKQQNQTLKISASIGGWTLSGPYSQMASNWESRQIFVQSVVDFIEKWGLDGIDIDWEYPQNTTEGGHYASLLKDLREALDAKFGNGTKEISSAVGATPAHIDKIGSGNYSLAAQYLDHIYVMSYDYWGAFSDYLGHQSNLAAGDDKPGIEKMVDALLEVDGEGGKIDAKKIIIGVANYARGKLGNDHTPGDPASAGVLPIGNPSFGTYEQGVVEAYDLMPNIAGNELQGINGFSLFSDRKYNADYFYNSKSKVYLSIDTPRTANLKARYVKAHNLGGIFSWTAEQDYQGMTVNAMNEGLGSTLSENYTSAADRQRSYDTCGINLNQQQCDALNQFITEPTLAIGDVALVGADTVTVDQADEGIMVKYRAPLDKDVWLVTLKQGGSFGDYFKVAAGSEGEVKVRVNKSWHPAGGSFIIAVSESASTPDAVQPLGQSPVITVTH